MTFPHLLVFKVPLYLLSIIIIGGTIGFALGGILLVRRFVSHDQLKAHHDVADPILGALAAVYAILLAFVVVTVWENYDKTKANVEMEANYLADLYRDAEAFGPEFRQKINPLLRNYRTAIIHDEWKTMAKGEMSPTVEKIMREIWATYTTYQPRTLTEQVFFEESVQKLNLFRELRRQRLMDARTGIPRLLWLVLIVEAFITIAFTFLFGAENLKVVMPLSQAAPLGDLFVTLTGNINVIRKEHFSLMKDQAIIANSGHFNVEIDIPALEKMARDKIEVQDNVTEYKLDDGRRLYLLAEGRLVNLAAAYGHPPEVMDMSFANQALSVRYIVEHGRSLDKSVYPVPVQIDRRVAELKLASMGLETEKLTAEQEKYLHSWHMGT